MSEFLVLQHIECEDLGTIANAMSLRGIGYKYVRLFDGEPVPSDPGNYSGMIILGGPMNVYEEDKFPYLKDEDILIKSCKERYVCPRYLPRWSTDCKGNRGKSNKRDKEGDRWYDLKLTKDSRQDKVFNSLPGTIKVFQWHGDTFDIPDGAVPCRLRTFLQPDLPGWKQYLWSPVPS